MFSLQIVDSDAFLDMPQSTQNLYFHFGMRADDDGFIDKPKTIMRMVGCSDDDYKILLAKRFLLSFESGVVVIKHWKIHNLIQADRYKPTVYTEEMKRLEVKPNKSYTEAKSEQCIQVVSTLEPQVRLGKASIGKESKEKSSPDKPEKHLSYLMNIPEEDKTEFLENFDIYERKLLSEAESAHDWIKANGKVKKDHKAFLRNWIKNAKGRDGSELYRRRTKEEIVTWRESEVRRKATLERIDATRKAIEKPKVIEAEIPVDPEAKKKLDDLRGGLTKKMTLPKRV